MRTEQESRRKIKQRRNLVVGVKVGGHSRGLLTWALMKVARPGDHVTVVHVVVKENHLMSHCPAYPIEDSAFDVYESFCRLKKINLQVKVSYGPSIRRALAEAALRSKASYLILGRGKHRTLGSSSSLLVYCAKKLSCTCRVLVVDEGRIIFEQSGTLPLTGNILAGRGTVNSGKSVFPSDVLEQPDSPSRSNSAGFSKIKSCRLQFSNEVIDPSKMEALKLCLPIRPLCRACATTNRNLVGTKKEDFEQDTATSESRSSFESFRTNSSNSGQISQKADDSSISSCRSKDVFSPADATQNTTSSAPGWPLMKCKVTLNTTQDPIPRTLARQMSVVEWAMTLPERRIPRQDLSGSADQIRQRNYTSSDSSISSRNSSKFGPDPVMDSIEEKEHLLIQSLENICMKKACRQFTYRELYSATSGFASEKVVGKGGWSRVYRGDLPGGHSVAVKSIKPSPEADSELLMEVEILTTVKHPHVISLLGYCIEDQKYYLVFNLLERGSLEDNLHGSFSKTVLSWKERLKVAIGIAEALEYLHHSLDPAIIHRDVKSSNILLSDTFEPQLSDFGLAKWASTTSAYITCSDVVGTFGYLAPEYFMYGKVNEKTDVYSFGVVLLELITGRKPINDHAKGQESLVIWARPLLAKGFVNELVDPFLEDNYDASQMKRMMLAASVCVMHASRLRPTMNQILTLLRGEADDLSSRRHTALPIDMDDLIEDEYGNSGNDDIKTHLTLAMLGVDATSPNTSARSQESKTLEDYFKQRCIDSPCLD